MNQLNVDLTSKKNKLIDIADRTFKIILAQLIYIFKNIFEVTMVVKK